MRRTTIGMFVVSALFIAACGSTGGSFANKARPAVPVNLAVYVNNFRVSVSPAAVGAGPVVFIVTNAAQRTESLMVQSPDGARTLASTGPINPQTTAEVTVDFNGPGDYTVAAGKAAGSASALASARSIQPATVHIGKPRPSSSNTLLQP